MILERLEAGERLGEVAVEAVAAEEPLTEDWRLEGPDLTAGHKFRLLPPASPPPEPTVVSTFLRRLNSQQSATLAKALTAAAAAEGFEESEGRICPALVSVEALQDLLLRLATSDSDLPEVWSGQPAAEAFSSVLLELDPSDCGFVPVASVIDFFNRQDGNDDGP